MTLIDLQKAKNALLKLAIQEGCSIEEIRNAIQESIDDAWNRAWTPGNLRAQVTWQQMFPGGRKPTVEEFIIAVATELKAGEESPPLLQ